tara:strand:+ start:1343 stop:1777 length:435 start_codon:yes stop_codon:yes gene_type:complete
LNILFHFDDWSKDVWSGREVDLDSWFISKQNWGIDRYAIVNNARIDLSRIGREIEIHASIESFLAAHEKETFIYLDLPKNGVAELLPDHTHDPLAWYLIGPAQGWLGSYPEGSKTLGIPQKGLDAQHGPFIGSILASYIYMNTI